MADTEMPQVRPPVKRVYLKPHEKNAILKEAWRLNHLKQYKTLTHLAREAVLCIADETRRPKVMSVTMPHWAWFREGLSQMIENPPPPEPEPTPEPEPVLEPEPTPEPEPEPTPTPLPGSFASLFRDPIEEPAPTYLSPTPAEIAASLPDAPRRDPAGDRDEEDLILRAHRRQRQRDDDLVVELRQLNRTMAELRIQISGMRADLQAMPRAIRDSLRDSVTFIVESAFRHVSVLPPPKPVIPVGANGHGPRPAPVPTERKPRVVVIGLSSGHQVIGVRKTVGDRAELTFNAATIGTYPPYESFDYIVVTKATPLTWLGRARERYTKDKLVIASGTAEDVGRRIAALPPIKLNSNGRDSR